MTSRALPPGLALAIHPYSRGFGWVAFEGPFTPYDWGLSTARRDKNAVCLRKIEKLLERLQPETIILEAFERRASTRPARTARLCRAIVSLAADRGLEVAIYSRSDVQAAFAPVGARTRDEIAAAVARHIDALRHRIPKARDKPWLWEDPRMALFSATALVLTHNQLGASGLFDSLP